MIPETGLLAAGTLLFLLSAIVLLLGSRRRKEQEHVIMLNLRADWQLRHLTPIWTGREVPPEIAIETLVRFWRAEGLVKGEKPLVVKLEQDRSKAFFEAHVEEAGYFKKHPAQQRICAQILELLDQEGDCPSVVDTLGEHEALNMEAFTILGKISLLDHTLKVAEAMIENLTARRLRHVLADGLIAALAHDLGKLPSLRNELYAYADHPVASGRYLEERVEEFTKLLRHRDILQAVKQHHKPNKNLGLLSDALVQADRLAREQELRAGGFRKKGKGGPAPRGSIAGTPSAGSARQEGRIKKLFLPPELAADSRSAGPEGAASTDAAGEAMPENIPVQKEASEMESSREESGAPAGEKGGMGEKGVNAYLDGLPGLSGGADRQELETIERFCVNGAFDPEPKPDTDSRTGKKAGGKKLQRADLEAAEVGVWYDEGILKREMRRHLNIVINACWTVFSMREGYVYCQPQIIEAAIRKMAENVGYHPITGLGSEDTDGMRPYFQALVHHLREREEDIIATGLIKEGYFSAYFDVVMENPRTGILIATRGMYTPFHAEWLGTVADFEKAKPARLKRIKSVKPAVNLEVKNG